MLIEPVMDEPAAGAATVRRHAGVVLHVRVVSGHGGGPEKTILNSPRYLQPFGYEAHCAYLFPEGDAEFSSIRARAAELEAPLVEIPDRGPLDVRPFRRLLELCRQQKVTIWHGHDYKSNLAGLLLRQFWPMKLVTTVHGWVKHTRRTPLYYAIDRVCLRYYDHVICVSKDLHQRCEVLGVPADKCTLIENAIDAGQYARTQSVREAKRRLGLDENRLLIGAAGRLSREKGFADLIRSLDDLLGRGLPVDLIIAGEGDQRPELAALVQELGRDGQIRLLGHRSDLFELFQAMDVFALSSTGEGLPNVILEAMALEVPVVATRVAGVPDLVEDGVTGLLVEPGDTRGTAAALEQLLRDKAFGTKLASRGRAMMEQHYGFAARMDQVRGIYAGLQQAATE